MMRALSAAGVLLPVGGRWLFEVELRDLDGYLTDDDALAVTVTLPDASTTAPTVEHVSTGWYRATYTTAAAGRHVASVVGGDDVAEFAAYVTAAATAAGMPTTDDVATYLGASAASWATAELQDALDAESAAQRQVCRIRAQYPADLRQALLRRVARNLAMRSAPLAVLEGDAEIGASRLPGRDPEVRRLEAPHRRLVVG